MTFEGLVEAIQNTGMSTDGLSEDQIIQIGKTLNLEVPLRVEVVEYTPKGKNAKTGHYVKTSGFPVTDADGNSFEARGLFLRVEAVDQAIEALQTAKAMLEADEHDGEG